MKGVYIFLADGFEDCEALVTADVLRRGGVKVNLVSVKDDPFVCSSNGLTVGVECSLNELDLESHKGTDARDVMIFPGGLPGAGNLAKCRSLIKAMRAHYDAGGSLAAICAAPGLVLSQLDERLQGVEFTCYDGFQEGPLSKGAVFREAPAVHCGRIITGRGPGYSFDFAFEILASLKGEAVADAVRSGMFLLK